MIDARGGFEIIEEVYDKSIIDPDDLRTGNSCLWYNVTARLFGRLERLDKSIFRDKKAHQ